MASHWLETVTDAWRARAGAVTAAALLLLAGCGGSNIAPSGDGGAADMGAPDFGPPHGIIDPTGKGGTVNLLAFTAFGDVRPSIPDWDPGYPTATITSIMQGMDALSPEFAVGTGDYMFVELLPSSASTEIGDLLKAEMSFHAPIFHSMGNHECNSFCDLNCPNLNESPNITAFMSMVDTWTKVPWYSFVVHTDLGDAKFVFVTANAWNDTQATWLAGVMAQPTRYTFIIRHHPTPDAGHSSTAPGIGPSDAIIDKYPVTLFLYGHVHEYLHLTDNAVVTGNAGAPLDTPPSGTPGSGDYGYVYVLQRPDGNISVTEYQQGTNSPIDTWAVTPDGKKAT